MNETIRKYFDTAAAHKTISDPGVVFRLTTNHPDFPTFAEGWLAAVPGGYSSDKQHARLPALVSNTVVWHFLRPSLQIVDCGPNDHQVIETIVFDKQKLVLSLFPDSSPQTANGQLRNPNWKSPILINELKAISHGGKGDVLYGSDANGALVTIALMVVAGPMWNG